MIDVTLRQIQSLENFSCLRNVSYKLIDILNVQLQKYFRTHKKEAILSSFTNI